MLKFNSDVWNCSISLGEAQMAPEIYAGIDANSLMIDVKRVEREEQDRKVGNGERWQICLDDESREFTTWEFE